MARPISVLMLRHSHPPLLIILLVSLAFLSSGHRALVAAEAETSDPFGLSATETHALIKQGETPMLFVDVRDPSEIQFTGFTDAIDANIPFLTVDPTRFNASGTGLLMERNPDFASGVAAALADHGLSRDALIVTMCRSGSQRGMPSASFLRQQGFPNAKYVIHGFQGDPVVDGNQAGMRLKNGWQNSGLPWSPDIDSKKISLGRQSSVSKSLLMLITSASEETQAMAMILAHATVDRGRTVRLLLCDEAGMLAVRDSKFGTTPMMPTGKSPRELLAALIERGVIVDVCGLFLPNRDIDPENLAIGIGVAAPPVISILLTDPNVEVLSF